MHAADLKQNMGDFTDWRRKNFFILPVLVVC
jgi:hypothetical protein